MTTAQVPEMYSVLAKAIGSGHWQAAVARSEAAIRTSSFLRDHLRYENAIAYQLDHLRSVVARFGTVPPAVCVDADIAPAMAFAAQVRAVLNLSTVKQSKEFVKRVRAAFLTSEEMHGLLLELQAATHFVRRGYRVAWHRRKKEGTFDLLVEDLGPSGLEVECKSISNNKGRRIHREEAMQFLGGLLKDVEGIGRGLTTGLAVVVTVPYRLPTDAALRRALAGEIVSRIMIGRGARLSDGTDVRIQAIDPKGIAAAKDVGRAEVRRSIDEATGTANRESIVYGTDAGGMLVIVVKSAVDDDVLEQVFSTLDSSASRQFSHTRGSLFWVAFRGLDAEELLTLHREDSTPGEPPSGLKIGVSGFLNRAPNHVVGVVFTSRSSLIPHSGGKSLSGTTNFFVKQESLFWHPNFADSLQAREGACRCAIGAINRASAVTHRSAASSANP